MRDVKKTKQKKYYTNHLRLTRMFLPVLHFVSVLLVSHHSKSYE